MSEEIEWDDEVIWDNPIEKAKAQQPISVVDKFTSSKLPEELKQDISSWWTGITQPNPKEPFDLPSAAARVGTSTAIGAGTGAILPVLGIPAGAASGFASGVAEEIARVQGASDLARVGAGFVGGEAPVVVGVGARGLAKVVSPANYRGGRTLGIFANDRLVEESQRQVKKNYFGKEFIDVNFIPQYTDEFQAVTKEALGIPLDNPNAVSSILRQRYYADVENLGQGGKQGFITSPEYQELTKNLELLGKINKFDDSEKRALNNILKLEVDKDQNARKLFSEEITNYIQNGGSFEISTIDGKPQTAKKINSKIQEALRDSFDKYLERNLGSAKFSELKAIERQEFEAQARDLIPAIVQSDGKLPKEDLDFIYKNAKNSPIVKSELSKAIMQRLQDPKLDTSAKLLTEFRKFNKDLVKIGVFDRKGLQEFYTKLKQFDEKTQQKEIKNFILTTLAVPTITATGANDAGRLFPSPLPKNQAPISAFSM